MDLITWLFIFSGSLGSLGSLAILVTFVIFRDLLTRSRKLIICLSLSDLGQSLFFGVFIPRSVLEKEAVCRLHNFLGILCESASCFWTAAIALHMYQVVRPQPLFIKFRWYHLVCWGYPLVTMLPWLLPWFEFTQIDDETTGWFFCLENTWVYLVGITGPLVFCWCATTVLYFLTIQRLRSFDMVSGISQGELSELQGKFALVPLVFLITKGPALAALYTFSGNSMPSWLAYLHAAADPLQGFINAIMFLGLSQRVRRRLFGTEFRGQSLPRLSGPLNTADDGTSYHTFARGRTLPETLAMGADPAVCDLATVNF